MQALYLSTISLWLKHSLGKKQRMDRALLSGITARSAVAGIGAVLLDFEMIKMS
jgi:hypothetical protein